MCRRRLDDAELDSGDDEGRTDRLEEEEAEQFEEREMLTMDMEVSRQAVPEPSDGEVRMLGNNRPNTTDCNYRCTC